ncbi:hypothetical protein QLX52_30615 [Streptomyces albus]|uniref:hypothetical protein n=1 Tax=Streptomyces albus TaxID=1888 RepID=UPI0006B4E4B9|nr:hypothetical protein [Streptomyces albus]KPC78270.1 hypothetical protein ADL27_48275 [Streptomyces sp. NRRL F-6602]MDI6413163.1 hypothetical protein [Streptomyces albus]
MIEATVSAAAGGACAGSAALLYYAEKLPGLKKVTNKLHTDRAQALLIATASAALVATPAGSWWNEKVNAVNDWAVGLVGEWTGLIITGVPALFVTAMFVNDLVTRKVENRTRILGAVLPVLASTMPGPIGSGIQSVLSWVVTTVGSLVAGAFGVA